MGQFGVLIFESWQFSGENFLEINLQPSTKKVDTGHHGVAKRTFVGQFGVLIFESWQFSGENFLEVNLQHSTKKFDIIFADDVASFLLHITHFSDFWKILCSLSTSCC